ncbi:MAG: IgA Peptidase M64 [Saprospiraceae bacterium]|nr:IgA Peptidase M64 [Saprospiraceae bacterium]
MKSFFLIIFVLQSFFSFAQFDNHFLNKTLRIDYFHTGNDSLQYYSIDELIEEPNWGGSHINLIDTFNYGFYKFEVYDFGSNKLLYSRGYNTLFNEWKTTEEAKHTWRSFVETVVFPFPKNKIIVKFYSRNKQDLLDLVFTYNVDPINYFISKGLKLECKTFKVLNSGNSSEKLDIVIIPDGYTKSEMKQFHKDCEKVKAWFLNAKPFSENKDKINIWGVEAISEESGTDLPGENIWKNTVLNTTFYTFDSERYLTTSDNKAVRNVAANVPYDQIFILVNTEKYGGGGIFNLWTVIAAGNKAASFLTLHEFGHGFAGLADEYYTSDVSVNDYHPLNIEPWEPNITTLVSFESKWKNMIDEKTPVPTPIDKKYFQSIGLFEGAGYVTKGVYRPYYDCTMKSVVYDYFCPVCQLAIQRMIDFYAK